MKKYNLILLALIHFTLINCYAQKKKKESIVFIDVKKEAEYLIDSLNKKGIDTIMFFYKGCKGCISGADRSGYVFWKKTIIIM